ncbi:Hypothetical predicted protein [Mytilus galloprovincialis]|uniref:Uncharacterized protein n=1 Tax=Mytilus galloprovincialis TaxID=29158 RepID=A0A8B6F1C8_MYTGA|nr:Hypothetical predicted protein [Mytilus galloprovincialis]
MEKSETGVYGVQYYWSVSNSSNNRSIRTSWFALCKYLSVTISWIGDNDVVTGMLVNVQQVLLLKLAKMPKRMTVTEDWSPAY